MGDPARELAYVGDDVQPGQLIAARYRLERPIGTGGMATIWEATHLALNRSIALKFVVIPGASPAKVRARFLREARVAAAVRHKHVVDILDFGTAADGRPFMAMELLVGRTLADRMEAQRTLSAAESVRILAQVLSGLAAVHDAGIVHRDLKPENVFLAEDEDGITAKLLDFGVSRAIDPRGELKSVLPTMENAIVGTPQYMSPEQARGLAEIDQRSDLWSAGAMLYELLTGELPFNADAIGDVIVQVATQDPPDLSTLRPDLAGPLAEVVRRAMQRDVEERFQSAREMRLALLRAVADTAHALRARGATDRERTGSLPSPSPEELLDAVGRAYEPGDSGLLVLAPAVQRRELAPTEEPAPTLEPSSTPADEAAPRREDADAKATLDAAPDAIAAPRSDALASVIAIADPPIEPRPARVVRRRARRSKVLVAAMGIGVLGASASLLALSTEERGVAATVPRLSRVETAVVTPATGTPVEVSPPLLEWAEIAPVEEEEPRAVQRPRAVSRARRIEVNAPVTVFRPRREQRADGLLRSPGF